jgi:predicted RNase H-like nuclease (RuvC/YqgF family)
MDRFWTSGLPQIMTIIGVFLSAVYGPKLVAKVQGKNKVEEVKTEGDNNAEALYIQNMGNIIEGYRLQVKEFKDELAAVRSEFREFKEEHEKQVTAYKEQIGFLELQVEERDERIQELEGENETLKNENTILKGGI